MQRLLLAFVLLAAAQPAGAQIRLTGAGSTFSNLLYQDWILSYHGRHPEVRLNYQSIGSGGGIKQFIESTVDFAGSDAPMTDQQIAAVGGNVLHIPTELGAVVVTYHLPGFTQQLRLTPELLAAMFLGEITTWADPRIAAVNPGVMLPRRDLLVVHRSDGSGTTYIFTDYLSKVSRQWAERVGKNTAVAWPVGLGGKGNEGVAATVQQTPGAIGYVELAYAVANHLPYAQIQNRSGRFIAPTVEATTAAMASALQDLRPETDFRVSITDAPGPDAYPIASMSFMLLRRHYPDAAKARALVEFVWWGVTEGQARAAPLGYAPLPPQLKPWIEARLKTITAGGGPVWTGPGTR